MRIALVSTPAGPVHAVEVDGTFTGLPEGTPRELFGRPSGSLGLAGLSELPEGATLLAPIVPGKIIGVGLNFMDTVKEMGFPQPTQPHLFSKFPSSVVAPGADIEFDPGVTTGVDWEVELAVVIGRRVRRVAPAEALEAVFGYTVANDVSARDLQQVDGQWVRGKSLDTFCPLGPVIVTADELPDPQRLRLRTWVNGELVQDGTTADMVFPVNELVSYCSRFFTLEPGDVILTGTPAGCGGFQDPPRFLGGGDLVEVEVEGIGLLANRVREVPATRSEQVGVVAESA